jgi:hypothetical protein
MGRLCPARRRQNRGRNILRVTSAAKAVCELEARFARLNRLLKNLFQRLCRRLKPARDNETKVLSARLKPCPDTKQVQPSFSAAYEAVR